MNTRYFIPLLFISVALLSTGCSPSLVSTISPITSPDSVTVTTRVTSTSTLRTQPRKTPSPKPTDTPTATLEPGLRTDGPYLVYVRDADQGQELVIMDADGKGRRVLSFPMEEFYYIPRFLSNLVSPDGKWLAYYSGSAGEPFGHIGTDTSDLSLNLMSLANGETKIITRLLSKDYPSNFDAAAKILNKPDINSEELQLSFLNGITQAISWSPDGRYLAFAGQMNGLSSDLYVYDTRTGTLKQLSSGPQEMQWIGWSPDGKWIIYGSTYIAGASMNFDIYATTLDGAVTNFLTSSSGAYDAPDLWLDNLHFFDNDSENGPGDYRLRLIDIKTGGIRKIWDGDFSELTLDLQKNWIAFNAFFPKWNPPEEPSFNNFQAGVQLINLTTLQHVKAEIPNDNQLYMVVPVNLKDGNFFVKGENNLLLLTTDGTLTDSGIGNGEVIASPDSNFLLVINEDMKIYSAKRELVRELRLAEDSFSNLGFSQNIIWRPDSGGFFAAADYQSNNLYAVDFLSGEMVLVESNYSDSPTFNYAWVNP